MLPLTYSVSSVRELRRRVGEINHGLVVVAFADHNEVHLVAVVVGAWLVCLVDTVNSIRINEPSNYVLSTVMFWNRWVGVTTELKSRLSYHSVVHHQGCPMRIQEDLQM